MKHGQKNVAAVLFETFRGYRRYVLILFVLGVLGAILDAVSINAIVPLLSFLIGGGQPTDPISRVIASLFELVGVPYKFRYLLVFVGLLIMLRTGSLALFTLIRSHVASRYFAQEVSMLMRGTMRSSWAFIVGQKTGNVQNAIFWDVKRTTNLLDSGVQMIQSSTGALMYLLVAMSISPAITFITIGVGAFLLVILRPLAARTRSLGAENAREEKALSHRIGEYLLGFKTIKAAAASDAVAYAAEDETMRLRDIMQRASVVKKLSSVLLQPASFLFIMCLFAISYSSPGFNLASFAATIYLVQKIFVYLESTQTSFYTIIELVPFAESVSAYKRDIAEHTEARPDAGEKFTFTDTLELAHLSLSYNGTTEALSDISIKIPRGSMLALVGPSGGGKTSIADMVMRLFQPTSGELLLDGVPAERIALSAWRRAIGYVSQDSFLMHASVRENIRFFDTDISDEDIEHAAKQAHIYETIQRLPEKFDTILGDRGATLSGGERQRVALARSLARKPQILVLDEVTSTLDSELERHITEVIDRLRTTTTLLVIAHRISTVMDADEILVIDQGRIVERGTPEKMAADPASYLSRMLTLQAGQKT